MNNTKTLLKNGVLFSIAPFLPKVVNIFLLPIMTKYLTDVDFGISGTISAYTSAISAFSTLGLTVVLQNSFFKTPLKYREIWKQIYGLLIIWMWIYAIIQSFILYFCIPEEAQENKWWIIILTNFSTVLFGPTSTIGSSYYIYSKQSFPIVWRSFFASILTILVDFVLIVYFKLGYMGWYVGTFAGIFFSNITYWYPVNKKLQLNPTFTFDFRLIKHSLSVGLPTIPHYYSHFLLEGSGRLVQDQYDVAQAEIGRLNISQQICAIFNLAAKGMSDAISPFVMEAIKNEGKDRILKISTIYISLIFSGAFFFAIWSKEIFSIMLSNESLASSYPYFILFIMAICYRPMYVLSSYYFFYHEETKKLLFVSFISGVIALSLYIILTPFWGIWGFLIGHYLSCLYYGYSGFFSSVYKNYAIVKLPYILIMCVQIIITLLAYFIVEYLMIKIICSILFFIICIANRTKIYGIFKKSAIDK